MLKTTMLTNASLLAAYAARQQERRTAVAHTLRTLYPFLAERSDDELLSVYDTSVSAHQSKDGRFLETWIEARLREEGIQFKAQVPIDEHGIILAKKRRGVTIPDIVFGNPIVGTHISGYKVLSLKTSSRERAKLDTAWTNKHPPAVFYYGTLVEDYPEPTAFGESATRKLVCAAPKDVDARAFKLGFEDLLAELR
jgi:hypothetical protein